jgi:hypothetical protein
VGTTRKWLRFTVTDEYSEVRSSFGDETVRAYVPSPLPPEPPVELSGLVPLIEQANRALGRLDGVTPRLSRWASETCLS